MKGFFPILVVGVICMFQIDSINGQEVPAPPLTLPPPNKCCIGCFMCADAACAPTDFAKLDKLEQVSCLYYCLVTFNKDLKLQSRGCLNTEVPVVPYDGCTDPVDNVTTCYCSGQLCNWMNAVTDYDKEAPPPKPTCAPAPATATATSATGLIGSIPLLVLGMAGVHLKYDLFPSPVSQSTYLHRST